MERAAYQHNVVPEQTVPVMETIVGLCIMVAVILLFAYLVLLPTLIPEGAMHVFQGAIQSIYSSEIPRVS